MLKVDDKVTLVKYPPPDPRGALILVLGQQGVIALIDKTPEGVILYAVKFPNITVWLAKEHMEKVNGR